tara:strand:- start:439 stop:1122 length:684 start_codon:yes stop_codon:yes gene_type:complete
MNKLLIDSREDSALTDEVLLKCTELNILFEKQWLEIGDYTFNDVCFEAKSAYDFLLSVLNKRLWNQLDNMDRAFDNNLVIVYGDFKDAYKDYRKYGKSPYGMIKNKFYGAMGKIILDLDCNILFVPNEKIAAQLIAVVCKMQPIDREVYNPRLVKQRKISTSDLRMDVLTTVKGISEKKAKLLIKEFGSIMEIGETDPSEIAMLDGFGKVLANRLYDVLNSEEKQVI